VFGSARSDVRTTKDLYRTVARALKAWPS
jgi:hypothetical protein